MIIGFPGVGYPSGVMNLFVYYYLPISLLNRDCLAYTLYTRPKLASPCMTGPRKPMPLNDVTVNDEVALVEEYKSH